MSDHPQPAGTTRLYRPTGPKELALVEASGFTKWPPRLPEQPIFYPVLNEWYATKIAREWNVPHAGVGFVTEFDVDAGYLERFAVQQVGGGMYWNCGSQRKSSRSSTRTSWGRFA